MDARVVCGSKVLVYYLRVMWDYPILLVQWGDHLGGLRDDFLHFDDFLTFFDIFASESLPCSQNRTHVSEFHLQIG